MKSPPAASRHGSLIDQQDDGAISEEKGPYRGKTRRDWGLDQPRRMLSAGGRIEPKGTSFVRL